MKKISLLVLVFFTSLLSLQTHAQPPSLKNTTWKLYVTELNDSITLHIKSDSSYVTTTTGEAVVKSVFKVSADTVFFTDYDGQYACPNATGKYKLTMSDDNNGMTLTLIEDACDGRANAMNKMKWVRSAATTPPAAQK